MRKINIKLLLFLLVLVITDKVTGQGNNNDEQKPTYSINDCEKLKQQFDKVKSWVDAHKGTKPDIPVPPIIEPDCFECSDGEEQEDKNQPRIDSFNKKSSEPEAGMITTILEIAKEKLYFKEGGNIFPGDNYPNEGKYECFDKMNDGDLRSMLESLCRRLRYKSSEMVIKYKKSPQYFFGGCSFYLGMTHDLEMIGFLDEHQDEEYLRDYREWAYNHYLKYQDRLLNEYQYQLYPETLFLPRAMGLLGFDLISTHLNQTKAGEFTIEKIDQGVEVVNKIISFMHFKLKMSIKANGHGENGAQISCNINGEAEIRCQIKQGRCYEWTGEGDANMIKFTVNELIFENESGILVYQGPKEFLNNFKLSIGLCDAEPKFILDIQDFGPTEENYKVSKPGGGSGTLQLNDIISTVFGGIMADQAMARFKQLENQQAELKELAARGEAGHNDPAYRNSAQGKKDWKRFQELKKEFGDQNSDAVSAMTKIIAPFKIGDKKPVDYTVNAKLLTSRHEGAGWDYGTLKLTFEEMADTQDNLKEIIIKENQ